MKIDLVHAKNRLRHKAWMILIYYKFVKICFRRIGDFVSFGSVRDITGVFAKNNPE